MTIAIVEDENNLRESLSYAIEKAGYKTLAYSNGKEAISAFRENLPDLIISDILMPLMDGLELCREVRKLSMEIPFIFLTSKDEEFDRILGLELGADDYLCKPFSLRELTTRIKVIFRRTNRTSLSQENLLTVGRIKLNLSSYIALIDENNINLTVTEFRLLKSLMEFPGHVKTREQLIEHAYPEDSYVSDRNVDCHIKRLRKKINKVAPDLNAINTVYGLGYKLEMATC